MTPSELLAEAKEEICGDSQEWAEVINEVMPKMLQSWLPLLKKVAEDGAYRERLRNTFFSG